MLSEATKRLSVAFAALLLTACNGAASDVVAPRPDAELGLFTTLPIYWGETPDIAAMLNAEGEKHWARQQLEDRYDLVPLDVLSESNLAGLERVLLAQPRPLSPQENVALDEWVREGGNALVFADPMLMQHSIYPIGDKRRPQDVVLLSPILARWGLALQFDEAQSSEQRLIESGNLSVPVAMAGELVATGGGAGSVCEIGKLGLIAECRIGEGRVVVVADADLFEPHAETGEAAAALRGLIALSF